MNQKPKKLPKSASENKAAFDRIIKQLRQLEGALVGGGVGAVRLGGAKGAKKDPAIPTPVEFKCDVHQAIKAKLPKHTSLLEFKMAYLEFDSEDDIECGVHVQKLIGGRMHSVEQRLGAEFIRRGLHDGYFRHERQAPR